LQHILVRESVVIQIHLRAGLLGLHRGDYSLQACSAEQACLLCGHVRQRTGNELVIWRKRQRLRVRGMRFIKVTQEKVRSCFARVSLWPCWRQFNCLLRVGKRLEMPAKLAETSRAIASQDVAVAKTLDHVRVVLIGIKCRACCVCA